MTAVSHSIFHSSLLAGSLPAAPRLLSRLFSDWECVSTRGSSREWFSSSTFSSASKPRRSRVRTALPPCPLTWMLPRERFLVVPSVGTVPGRARRISTSWTRPSHRPGPLEAVLPFITALTSAAASAAVVDCYRRLCRSLAAASVSSLLPPGPLAGSSLPRSKMGLAGSPERNRHRLAGPCRSKKWGESVSRSPRLDAFSRLPSRLPSAHVARLEPRSTR